MRALSFFVCLSVSVFPVFAQNRIVLKDSLSDNDYGYTLYSHEWENFRRLNGKNEIIGFAGSLAVSANRGNIKDIFNIARCYYYGIEVGQDSSKALF